MFLRALGLAFVLNSSLAVGLLPPMLVGMAASAAGVGFIAWRISRGNGEHDDELMPEIRDRRSPFALRPALQFGVIFAVVLWLSRAAQVSLGDAGAYLSSIIGGAAGMDAVTLSMAKLSGTSIAQETAVRAVTLGAAANMVFKGVIALILGSGAVKRLILPIFTLTAVISVIVAFLMV